MENISWVLSLPDEILNGIFYHLNQATVMNTMLISKKFYQIGLQKLYRRIYVLGDFWPSISLSPQADTSFHREFTIINKWKQFELFLASKHISLVKYILFRDTDVECEQEMFSQWPWITVEFEIPCDGQEASIKALMKDNTHNIFLNDWVSLEEDNHTVKILNIRLTESSANVLDLVPHMKALESVAITIGSLERFDSLDLSSKQLLKIKTLNIGIEEVNGIGELKLERLFDLNEITTVGIQINDKEVMVHEKSSLLLLQRLPNLKNFLINTRFFSNLLVVVASLPKNSLQRLCIGCNEKPPLKKYIKLCMEYQSTSIKEFCYNAKPEQIWSFSLSSVFDRVYKIKWKGKLKRQEKEIRSINSLLQDERPYPNLYHVVLNQDLYIITRTGDSYSVKALN